MCKYTYITKEYTCSVSSFLDFGQLPCSTPNTVSVLEHDSHVRDYKA